MTTYEKIAQVISRRFKVPAEKIHLEADFDDLGLDSLSQIELAMALKKEHGFDISDDQLEQISTVGDIVATVESLQ